MRHLKFFKASLPLLALPLLSWSAQLYVSPSGSGTECSQTNPCSLETALSQVESNGEDDTLFLEGGVYELTTGQTVFLDDGKSLTIQSREPTNKAILDGDPDNDPATDNSVRPLVVSSDIVGVDDSSLTIRVANLIFRNGAVDDNHGGGLQISTNEGDVEVEGCEFISNRVKSTLRDGGGAYIQTRNGSVTVRNSIFRQNSAGNIGGGLQVSCFSPDPCTGNVLIEGNVFDQNSAEDETGGLWVSEFLGSAVVQNNLFVSNTATNRRGGAFVSGAKVLVFNNTFYNNSAGSISGGLEVYLLENTHEGHVVNNIFWNNSGASNGDDLFVYSDGNADGTGSPISLKNNIFSAGADLTNPTSGVVRVTHTGNYSQSGNKVGEDPLFVDASTGDFRLQSSSPAIDSGTDALPTGFSLPDSDLDGFARVINGTGSGSAVVDMGAYEYGVVLEVSKSGDGSGTVSSSPNSPRSINCGSACKEKFHVGSSITLSASADSGSQFSQWQGDCSSCGSTPDCSITLDSDKSCTAVFALAGSRGGGGSGGGASGGGGGGCSAVGTYQSILMILVPFVMLGRRVFRQIQNIVRK